MNQLRFWFVATFLWWFAFYNLERLHQPINMASFAYAYAAAAAVLIIAFRSFARLSSALLVSVAVGLLLPIKLALGYAITGPALPLTVTEACATGITVIMACKIAHCLRNFEDAAGNVLLRHYTSRTVPFREAQSDMYREIRRARQHERPLAIVAVTPDSKPADVKLDRLIAEIQRDAADQYLRARVGDLLSRVLGDCSIIGNDQGRFYLLLPETTRHEAADIFERIEQTAYDELGIKLHVGICEFPSEEITFSGLVERASGEMRVMREFDGPQGAPPPLAAAMAGSEAFKPR